MNSSLSSVCGAAGSGNSLENFGGPKPRLADAWASLAGESWPGWPVEGGASATLTAPGVGASVQAQPSSNNAQAWPSPAAPYIAVLPATAPAGFISLTWPLLLLSARCVAAG